MGLEHLSGHVSRRDDYGGHLAKLQGHYWAVNVGKPGQGVVGLVPQRKEIPNDGKRGWSWGKLGVCFALSAASGCKQRTKS